jgi:hypothetical protein
MKRHEQIAIKQEFDKLVKYFEKRGDNLSIGEVKQELGALRLFIYQLGAE